MHVMVGVTQDTGQATGKSAVELKTRLLPACVNMTWIYQTVMRLPISSILRESALSDS